MIAIKADCMEMANEERQIEDPPCDVTFTQEEHIHEDKKTLQCKICSGFFSRKNNLHVHIHKIHKDLPLTCHICENPLNKKASRNFEICSKLSKFILFMNFPTLLIF